MPDGVGSLRAHCAQPCLHILSLLSLSAPPSPPPVLTQRGPRTLILTCPRAEPLLRSDLLGNVVEI